MDVLRYKKYINSPNASVPGRTLRRQKRLKLDRIISGEDSLSRVTLSDENEDVIRDDSSSYGDSDDDVSSVELNTSSSTDIVVADGAGTVDDNQDQDDRDGSSISSFEIPGLSEQFNIPTASPDRMETAEVHLNVDHQHLTHSDANCSPNTSVLAPAVDHSVDEHLPFEEDLPGELPDCLCECTSTTEGEALLSVLALGLRHNLSWVCMVDILKMINVLFRKNVVPESKYFLLKYSEPDRSDETFHVYCPSCSSYLEGFKKEEADKAIKCTCGYEIASVKSASSVFMTLGIKEQLQEVLKIPEVEENMDNRSKRKKQSAENLEDLYDGQRYETLSQPEGPLADPNNYSYNFFLDGCSLGEKTKAQVWPIYLSINELPPKLRMKFMILVGIWVGKLEPDMQVFLQPFVGETNSLSTTGLTWMHNGKEKVSKFIPLCCNVDSQARWRLLNMKMFNGHYGCTMCLHPGDSTFKGVRYSMHEEIPDERTDETLRRDMHIGYMKNQANRLISKKLDENGCRGLSALYAMQHIDLSECLVGDYMHNVKGVVEQHLKNLFGPYNARFFIDYEVDNEAIISERLVSLAHPSVLSRSPRPLSELEVWKCSEFRSFLLFYVPVVFKGVLIDKYVVHFCMLSSAMHILLQKSVSRAEIEYANELLVTYVILYEKYFGIECMTFNIHLLLHVAKGVLNFGPIWTHNCFPYEGENHYLLLKKKSPAQVAKEIVRKHRVFQNLPHICEKFKASDEVMDYCEHLFRRQLKFFVRSDNCVLMGQGKSTVLSNAELVCLQQLDLPLNVNDVYSYHRMLYAGFKLCTKSYCSGFKTNDSGLFLKNGDACRLTNIVRISHADESVVVLFARKAVVKREPLHQYHHLKMKHIQAVENCSELVAFLPKDISRQAFFLEVSSNLFVTTIPYGCQLGD